MAYLMLFSNQGNEITVPRCRAFILDIFILIFKVQYPAAARQFLCDLFGNVGNVYVQLGRTSGIKPATVPAEDKARHIIDGNKRISSSYDGTDSFARCCVCCAVRVDLSSLCLCAAAMV
jgi:hypothetical protein